MDPVEKRQESPVCQILLLFYLKTITMLDLNNKNFDYVQYFRLTLPLNNVDIILNPVCH